MSVRLDPVSRAISDIAAGRPVVVVDDQDRENEGDIIFAAAAATPELMAFTIRYSSGVICAPMPADWTQRLALPLMVADNQDPHRTAFTVSVDAASGVSTGISAADRAHTVRLLAEPSTTPGELTRPGHVFPLRYREGGVLVRRGHTEAAVDLARLAGHPPVGVLVEITHDDGTMMRAPALREFADTHGLAMISIEDLAAHRLRTEHQVERVASTMLPTEHGDFTAHAFRSVTDGIEHLALVFDEPDPDRGAPRDLDPPLVRVHSECLTGDVFGSLRCDCGPQLSESLRRIAGAGRGVVLYLRGHEGRGIGLGAKLQAYSLQDAGRDTVDANLDLGLPADARDYAVAAQILRDLEIDRIALLTNNPAKVDRLSSLGVEVVHQVPLSTVPNKHNLGYLRTKRDRMGHTLADLPDHDHTTGPSTDRPTGDDA